MLGQSFTLAGLGAVVGHRGGRPRGPPAVAVPARVPPRGSRPTLAGARPVRLRPGADPRGRLQHDGARRSQDPPPRGGPALRGARVGRARRRPRQPVPRGAREQPRRARNERPSRGQARIALRAAADRATALGAHEQALRFCEQALTVVADTADEASLHERAGEAAAAVARVEDAATHYRAAIELRAKLGDRGAEARVTASYASALVVAYRFDDTLALLTEASERFADLADDPGVATLNGQLARAYFLDRREHEGRRRRRSRACRGRAAQPRRRGCGHARHARLGPCRRRPQVRGDRGDRGGPTAGGCPRAPRHRQPRP